MGINVLLKHRENHDKLIAIVRLLKIYMGETVKVPDLHLFNAKYRPFVDNKEDMILDFSNSDLEYLKKNMDEEGIIFQILSE